MYNPPPAKIPILELFNISLEGRSGNRDAHAAVGRLLHALNHTPVVELIKMMHEVGTERLQFLNISNLLLRTLTPKLELNKKSYSEKTFEEHGVNSGIGRKFLGMGSHQTWHGIPDGRTDWVSLQIVSRDTEASIDSDSELSAGSRQC